ncbi:MAG: hypothetical protein H8E31_00240 [Planctomycetes bacterium]|nr:hypothetical protein [Planctomycetota bacterium]
MNWRIVRWNLEELASREEQERVWLGHSDKEMSSIEEAACGLLDDSGLAQALDDGDLEDCFSREFLDAIQELRRALKALPCNEAPSVIV